MEKGFPRRRWNVTHYYKGKILHSLEEIKEAAAQLPSLEEIRQTEPLNQIVSAKVQESLALWLKSKPQGASPFLRKLIEQAYEREQSER